MKKLKRTTNYKLDSRDIYDKEQMKSLSAIIRQNEAFKRNSITTTGTGENVTLDKTAEDMEFKRPPLPIGNSTQKTYNGKQLLNTNEALSNTSFDETTNIFTFDLLDKYDHLALRNTMLATISANTDYKIVVDIIENTANDMIAIMTTAATIFYGSDVMRISAGEKGKKVFNVTTREDLENATYDLWLSHVNTINGTFKCKIMVMKATETDTSYEKYVGRNSST